MRIARGDSARAEDCVSHRLRAVRPVLWRLGLLAAALAIWQVWAAGRSPVLYVPPTRILAAFWRLLRLETYPALPGELALTLLEIVAAYALALVVGTALGLTFGLARRLGAIYEPMLAALYAVPSVVWYPSLMLLFGLGPASKVAFGFLLGFFPIALAVRTGVHATDGQLLTVARSFGAGPLARFAKVVLPGMAATLVAGLRAGLALTVVGVIVGEVLGARGGIGYLIGHAYGLLRTADYAALAVLALLLVMAIDAMAGRLEARARRWAG